MNDKKNNPDDAETNSWYKLMQESIKLDGDKNPHGYHWLFSLKRLLGTDVKKIQLELPPEHPLKLIKIPEWNNERDPNKRYQTNDKHPLKNEIAQIKNDSTVLKKDLQKDDKINLSNLEFKKDAYFLNFIFPIDVDFTNSTFSQNVYFNGAIFTKNVNFKEAVFCGKISKFRNVAFDKIANFTSARFEGYANFKGSIIKGRTSFQKAIFESHAPRFYEAKFSNEMIWAGIDLPSLAKSNKDDFDKEDERFNSDNKVCWAQADANHKQRIQENQNSYENTSILLKGAEKYHDQHFFFRYEMQCRRWLGGRFNCFIYRLYECLADYGYGVGRAFSWWAFHILVGAGFIALIAYYQGLEIGQGAFCSISTSFANANPFVFFGFKEGALMECYECLHDLSPLLFGTIRGLQTLIGIPILFLLLTTLRVRFRLN